MRLIIWKRFRRSITVFLGMQTWKEFGNSLRQEELSKAYGLLTDATDSRDADVRSLVASSLKGC